MTGYKRVTEGVGFAGPVGEYSERSGLLQDPCAPDLDADLRFAQIARTIEGEIIPRLMLAHRTEPSQVSPAVFGFTPGKDEVAEFARLVMAHDVTVAVAYCEALRAQGVTLEALFLDLLAPTARQLGELWKADLCHFTDVTVGLCRLQQLLRELGPAFENEIEHREHGRRALLVPCPGEQHSFGISMVEEFFRRAGWDVWGGPTMTTADLAALVRNEWFAVVGISASCESLLDVMTLTIRQIRRESCNPALGVIVGGRCFVDHPERVASVGADATAADGRQAIFQAESLLGLMSKRC